MDHIRYVGIGPLITVFELKILFIFNDTESFRPIPLCYIDIVVLIISILMGFLNFNPDMFPKEPERSFGDITNA
jgi:hypothetical protein